MGWSATALPVIDGQWQEFWTTAEAAALLGPPALNERQVRELVRARGLAPAGRRRDADVSRRYLRVYPVPDLIQAYENLAATVAALTAA